uniref:Uncharacterized protein n=1 Tax=Aquila chrysaetos chrysaetos TaxID=223781 RepID=A0A663EAC3_AQUCH
MSLPFLLWTVVTWGNKGIGFTIVRAQRRQFLGDAVAYAAVAQSGSSGKTLGVEAGLWDFLRRSYRHASVLVNNAAVIFKGCSRPAVRQSFALESQKLLAGQSSGLGGQFSSSIDRFTRLAIHRTYI